MSCVMLFPSQHVKLCARFWWMVDGLNPRVVDAPTGRIRASKLGACFDMSGKVSLNPSNLAGG